MNKEPAADPVHSGGIYSLSLRLKMLIGFGLLFSTTLAAVIVVMAFGIPFTDYTGLYGHEQSEVLNKFGLIADLKKERLLLWLQKRQDDAKEVSENMVAVAPSIDRGNSGDIIPISCQLALRLSELQHLPESRVKVAEEGSSKKNRRIS